MLPVVLVIGGGGASGSGVTFGVASAALVRRSPGSEVPLPACNIA